MYRLAKCITRRIVYITNTGEITVSPTRIERFSGKAKYQEAPTDNDRIVQDVTERKSSEWLISAKHNKDKQACRYKLIKPMQFQYSTPPSLTFDWLKLPAHPQYMRFACPSL